MKNENSRLSSFIGNEHLCESEYGGEPSYQESEETANKYDFETFISKGSDALIRDHPDLVKRLI